MTNKIKIILISIVTVCSIFFINIDDVKAGTIEGGPGYGYAQCSYRVGYDYGNGAGSTVKLIVKVWGSKSDGKNWLNWNNAFSSADNWSNSVDSNIFNYDVPSTYTGFGDNTAPNDDGTNVISALYSENYNTAMGQNVGEFSCPSFACIQNVDNRGYSYNWQLPSKKQLREGTCPNGYKKATTNTYNPEETQTSNTATTDGQIYYEKIKDEDWTGAYTGDVEAPTTDEITAWGNQNSYDSSSAPGDPCRTITSNPWLVELLNMLFWFIAIAGLVIFLIMSIMDFIKAITGSEDANLKKAFKNLLIRAIVVVILFLLPALLSMIINFLNNNLGEEGTYQIGEDGNLYCDVISSN